MTTIIFNSDDFESSPLISPDYDGALTAIHEGLISQAIDCPFCQIRAWADADLTVDARMKDFVLAFQQPENVRPGAIQSALMRLWSVLSSDQQTALNTAAIATWGETYALGLTLPWS